MKLKRASKKTEHLGIKIEKYSGGYMPELENVKSQKSICFSSADSAVAAVLDGFRPTPTVGKEPGE